MAKKTKRRDEVLGEGHTATADAAQAEPQARMKRKQHERELRRLHGELVAMQAWVKASAANVCVVFEGRTPPGRAAQTYLQRYIQHLPARARS